MNPTTYEALALQARQIEVLVELLESERTRLLVEINHTDHRAFRHSLHERLTVIEELLSRVRTI